MKNESVRLRDVDVAKGIAIVLVVWGHIVARDGRPAGNDWYVVANGLLYTFHMAFFFYLAGYVYWMTPQERTGARIRSAAAKMVPAYLLFALAVYLAKWTMAPYLHVDRPIASPLQEWLLLVQYPTEAFASFLWFVVVLLEMYGLAWLFRGAIDGSWGLAVLAIALIVHLLSISGYVTSAFALHQVARYWLFFVLARWALHHRSLCLEHARQRWWFWLGLFTTALVLLPLPLLPTAAALLSLHALHGMALKLEPIPRVGGALSWLGNHSWTIFLMNSLALGAVRALVLKTSGWDGSRFLVAAPVLLAAGVLVPIMFQRCVLARSALLDRITR